MIQEVCNMPVTIVVGGQYGSEGKGKVVALTARQFDSPAVVRCGGPNSGHSTVIRDKECVLRQLPAAAGQNDVAVYSVKLALLDLWK